MIIKSLITARGNSKSIRKKNISLINGKPLIYWTINIIKKSYSKAKVFISTDSKKIANIAKNLKKYLGPLFTRSIFCVACWWWVKGLLGIYKSKVRRWIPASRQALLVALAASTFSFLSSLSTFSSPTCRALVIIQLLRKSLFFFMTP